MFRRVVRPFPFEQDTVLRSHAKVAFEADWLPPAVSDLGTLLVLELMMPGGHKQKEVSLEAEVLHVRQATPLAFGPLAFCQANSVLLDQFLVDGFRVFCLRDSTGDVPPVAMPQVDRRLWPKGCY